MSHPNPTDTHAAHAAQMTQALRAHDPEAQVHIDADSGQLSVATVLSESEVLSVLQQIGVEAAVADEKPRHGSGGCCGRCGG